MLFLQEMHALHQNQSCSSNNQANFERAGLDPDQQHCIKELSAGQATEYSSGEQVGLENTLINTLLLVLCYSLNTSSDTCILATITIWTSF